MILYEGEEEERRPVAWEEVEMGDDLDAFCDAVDAGDEETVEAIVGRAYARAYARLGGEMLKEIDGEL